MGLRSVNGLIVGLVLTVSGAGVGHADTYTYTPSPAGEAALDYVTNTENTARAKLEPPAPPVTKAQMFEVIVTHLVQQYIGNAKQKQTEEFLTKAKTLNQADRDAVEATVGVPLPK